MHKSNFRVENPLVKLIAGLDRLQILWLKPQKDYAHKGMINFGSQ
jgi:hypothetical protein